MKVRGSVALACALVAFSSLALAETLPAGGVVKKALGVDVPPKGIDFLMSQGVAMVPPQINVPSTSGSQSCFGIDSLDYSLYQGQPSNGLALAITTATVVPQDGGYFDLNVSGTVTGTGTDTPPGTSTQTDVVTRVEYSGCLTSCNLANNHFAVVRLTPMPFSMQTKLYMTLTFDALGNPVMTVTTPLGPNDITLDPTKIDAAGCGTIDILVAIVKNFISDQMKQLIVDQVNQSLIPAIENGFAQAKYDSDLAVAGTTLHVKLAPSGLAIDHNGLLLSMSSSIKANTPTTCIPLGRPGPDGFPVGGSAFTPGDLPLYGITSPHGMAFDAAAGISDDLLNQGLYAAWNGGLLCQTISSLGGTPLDTSFLAVAGLSGALNRLDVAEGTPMLIVIKDYQPPVASFGGAHPINIDVKKLELSIFTEVKERTARIVALDLDATAGIDLTVDADNKLNIALALDPAAMVGSVAYGEPMGDDAASILNLLPILAGQIGPALGGAIPPIDLSNLAGVGLVGTEFDPEQGLGGVPNDTLSLYTGLAAAPGGCNAGGGTGCGVGSTGCDVSNARARNGGGVLAMLALAPLLFVARRRRSV